METCNVATRKIVDVNFMSVEIWKKDRFIQENLQEKEKSLLVEKFKLTTAGELKIWYTVQNT